MSNFISAVKTFMDDENGVTAIEYGLIAALIGVSIVTASGNIKGAIEGAFNYVAGKLNAAVTGSGAGAGATP